MIHVTKAIVLKVTPYAESSVVVQLYTEKFGVTGFIINGVRKPNAKISAALLQPLNLLEATVYYKDNTQLHRVKTLQPYPPYQTIPFSNTKRSMVLFLNELLWKTLKHYSAEDDLFAFAYNALQLLDNEAAGNNNFHLSFILKLSRFYGFGIPEYIFSQWLDKGEDLFYNLLTGEVAAVRPQHAHYFNREQGETIRRLMNLPLGDSRQVILHNAERRRLLQLLLDYYGAHVPDMGVLRSHTVLEELYSD